MKNLILLIITVFFLLIHLLPIHAGDLNSNGSLHPHDITSSGLGTVITSEGGTFDITGGTLKGSNLFHSFGKFNLHSGESAIFHDTGIQNTIARVTGGEYSWVNGNIKSGAESLYLLNPAGVMFGPNASLDLAGSFHVSTADYLRLGENERFYTTPQENELLSVAPPTAFGFLDNDAASISVQGKGELTTEVWDKEYEDWRDWRDNNPDFSPGLLVSEGKTISMIGGEIKITGTFFALYADFFSYLAVGASLSAPDGSVNLVSVSANSEVEITDSGVQSTALDSGGITLSDGAVINVNSGTDDGGAGSVFIRGGTFVLDTHSQIKSEATHEDGGVIDIEADNVFLKKNTLIKVDTSGTGNGTKIKINASEDVHIDNGSICNGTFLKNENAGAGGDLSVKAKNVYMSGDKSYLAGDKSYLGGESFGGGKGGDILIDASESSRFSEGALISTSATEWSTGRAGDITIISPSITIETGAAIESMSGGAGEGGNVFLHTENLQVMTGGKISVSAEEIGNGGNVFISGSDVSSNSDYATSVTILGEKSRILANTSGTGNAGTVSIAAKKLLIADKASIVTSTADAGNAGNIILNVEKIELCSGASVRSESMPGTRIYTVANPEAKDNLIDAMTKTAKEGDIIIVEDMGDGLSSVFINWLGSYWIQLLTEDIHTVAKYTDLNAYESDKAGTIVIVQDVGDGNPAVFVNGSYNGWIKIKKVYTGTELTQQVVITAIEGDLFFIADADSQTATPYIYTGEEWITYNNFYEVKNLAERDNLSVQKGDVAKVTDAGNGMTKGFIYTGEKWITMYMSDSGTITINAEDSLRLSGNSTLTTESVGSGGGKIFVNVGNEIYLHDSEMTSSVKRGMGKGGDVIIRSFSSSFPEESESEGTKFVILNQSDIKANAEDGDGGAIFIHTENYIKSSDSKVTATSNRGNDGTVKIESPDLNITPGLTSLSENYIDATKWMQVPCSARFGESVSCFIIKGRDGISNPLNDWLPSPLLWLEALETRDVKSSDKSDTFP